MKISLFLLGILGSAMIAQASAQNINRTLTNPFDTPSGSVLDYYYEVYGKEEISAEESAHMVFDETHQEESEIIHIQGFDIVKEDGSIEESALDGMGLNRGFLIFYPTPGTHDVTISMEGIKHFQNFYAEGKNVAGGAIGLYNGGDINFNGLQNVVTFTNNIIEATSGHASGGAIFVTGGGAISDLRADFIGNEARVNEEDSGQAFARGGAIFVGKFDSSIEGYPVSSDPCIVGNLYGNFTENKAAFGGAIYLGEYGVIGNIHGNFNGNVAEGSVQPGGTTGGSQGGAIRAWMGTIGTIYGNFNDNVSHSVDGHASGGAISLDGTIINGGFHGDFTGNIARSENAEAEGGALAIKNQSGDAAIVFTDVSFTGNGASTTKMDPGAALGGAVYVENSSDVIFRAVDQDVNFTDNFLHYGGKWDDETGTIEWQEGDVLRYNAIYAIDSTVTLEAQNDSTITINDGIGLEGDSELIINGNSSERYDVVINDGVASSLITIENGGLKLDTYTHNNGVTTNGHFTPNTLSGDETHVVIKENGILNARAQYLDDVNTITLDGELELTADEGQESGTLKASVNYAGKNTGKINIFANTTIAENNSVYAHELSLDHHLNIEAGATVDISHLSFHANDMADINGTESVLGHRIEMNGSATLDFDVIDLVVEDLNYGDYYDLIVSDGMGDITLDWDFDINVYTYGGLVELEADDYDVVELADGGLRVVIKEDYIQIPEPSTATLSLLALAGLMARRRRRA